MLMGTKVAYLLAACFHWYVVHKTRTFRYFKLPGSNTHDYTMCMKMGANVTIETIYFPPPGLVWCSEEVV